MMKNKKDQNKPVNRDEAKGAVLETILIKDPDTGKVILQKRGQ